MSGATAFPEMDHAFVNAGSAPLGAFVSLTSPTLALGRDGTPRVVPVEVDTEGLARRLTAEEARELAALLSKAASACDRANRELLPPLNEYCARYRSLHSEEASA